MVVARRAPAPVLLHASLVSNRRAAVQIDRAEISAEQCGCRRRDARADMAWMAGTSGGWGAQVGGDEQRFVARDALLYGGHGVAGYGCGGHGPFPGWGRSASRYATPSV